ncbi:hypothetical protein B0H63DRAFT_178569 [Podospora didyma]|uniref:Uncharacterized protein n=1 Tax=Podospora didyma TaxID=330526 RepID=A0AAE0NP78_9PEZI|nr:hypothetical protein B0H63DRAFT_178569 [Podospora didyma]
MPAPKRQTHASGAPTSHNSITVASGRSSSNASSSAASSPVAADKVQVVDEGVGATTPAASSSSNNNNNNMAVSAANGNPFGPSAASSALSYENSNLDEITLRQLQEDIISYNHDMDFCKAQLEEPDLTPQEMRTLQLRTLDLGHQIRHCRHRIETLQIQLAKSGSRSTWQHYGATASSSNGVHGNARPRTLAMANGQAMVKRVADATPLVGKRSAEAEDEGSAKRVKTQSSPDHDTPVAFDGTANTSLQRLGLWRCRLCSAPKYLLAGNGRSPAAPCKWPLKDISKMITHFTEMHTEHTPVERCAELGAALSVNRGPFEYWLRRTRAQTGKTLQDGAKIDECIEDLINGEMPDLLRRLSRAAAGMPAS